MQRDFSRTRGLGNRESRTDDKEKMPGLVPQLSTEFRNVPLLPDNRGLNRRCYSRCLALPLLMTRRGGLANLRANGEALVFWRSDLD